MRYQIVTIFPELVQAFAEVGLMAKAIASGRIVVETMSPREHTTDRHQSVDDAPFGGGSGMVMRPEPLALAMEAFDASASARGESLGHRVLLSPQGTPLTQARVRELAGRDGLMLICGRYEGIDERICDLVDEQISLGDFVLNGGELAALALVEATARLLPGVLGNAESLTEESHAGGLLEYPQYTRPREFRGQAVPDVLLSGDHARIARWRRRMALLRTRERRPDLFAALELDAADRALLEGDEP